MKKSVRSPKIVAPRIVSLEDIPSPPRPQDGAHFGRWRFDSKNLTLTLDEGRVWYEIDLERCRTHHDILDWLLQVSLKTWATPEDVGYLLKALNALADNGLQASTRVDYPQLLHARNADIEITDVTSPRSSSLSATVLGAKKEGR